jgi:hypothetical protein
MNSQATSVAAWRRHRSAIAARLVYLREIDRTDFWEFCNSIVTKRTSQLGVALHESVNGDGAVVSYLNSVRTTTDNDETYGKGISFCVRAPQHVRTQTYLNFTHFGLPSFSKHHSAGDVQ